MIVRITHCSINRLPTTIKNIQSSKYQTSLFFLRVRIYGSVMMASKSERKSQKRDEAARDASFCGPICNDTGRDSRVAPKKCTTITGLRKIVVIGTFGEIFQAKRARAIAANSSLNNRSRKDQYNLEAHRARLLQQSRNDHRHRLLQVSDPASGSEGARYDLGYGRSGAIPRNYLGILSRSACHCNRLRHHSVSPYCYGNCDRSALV